MVVKLAFSGVIELVSQDYDINILVLLALPNVYTLNILLAAFLFPNIGIKVSQGNIELICKIRSLLGVTP